MKRNLVMLAAVAVLIAGPLMLAPAGSAFKGSDDRGTAAIGDLRPDYQPWFAPLWTPPSPEIESLLFALQAALGAGVLGYCLGLRQGRRRSGCNAAD